MRYLTHLGSWLTRHAWWVLGGIILVAAAVRLYKFGSLPNGVFQDEASLSYDAWSLLTYGVERNGFHFPVILPAYGSGMSGTLAAYLQMPFLMIFGLTPVATRAVNLTMGLAAIPMLYLLARKVWNTQTALVAAFILAISPWHIMQSRWGLDCNLFPPLFLAATLLFVHSLTRPRYIYAAMALYAFCFYAYATSYFVVPVFLLCTAIYFYRYPLPKIRRWHVAGGLAVFVVISLPIGLYLFLNRFHLPGLETPFFSLPHLPSKSRLSAATLFADGTPWEHLQNNFRIFTNLMQIQWDKWTENSMSYYGIVYPFTMPLAAVGLVSTLQEKRNRADAWPRALMLFWLLAAALVGLVLESVVHRVNIIYFIIILFAAAGLVSLRRWPTAIAVVVALYCLLFYQFTSVYFTNYAKDSAQTFMSSFGEAIHDASSRTNGIICVTRTDTTLPDIQVLYWEQIDPKVFSSTVVYQNPGDVYRTANSFGRYRFGLENCTSSDIAAYVVRPQEAPKYKNVDIQPFDRYWVLMRR